MPFLAKIGAALKGAAVKAAKAKATEKAIETAQDENAKNMLLLSGCGCFAAFLFLPIFIVIVLFNEVFGTIQIADGAELNSGSIEADGYLGWAIAIAEDNSHGYDQGNRTGPDYDCSSLVWYSLVNGADFDKEKMGGYPFSTHSEAAILKKNGFKEYTYTSEEDLQPGDILLRAEHTEIYAGDSKTVGAHMNEFGGITGGKAGDQTGKEIDVGPNYGNWSTYYRLEG